MVIILSYFHGFYILNRRTEIILLNKEEILEKKKKINDVPGIYFLIKEEEIVYIGSSKNTLNRIRHHLTSSKKNFNYYYIIPFKKIKKKNLLLLESEYILKFFPKYNRSIPKPREIGLTIIDKIKYNYGWKEWENIRVDKWLFKHKIPIFKIGIIRYFRETDIFEALLNGVEKQRLKGEVL